MVFSTTGAAARDSLAAMVESLDQIVESDGRRGILAAHNQVAQQC